MSGIRGVLAAGSGLLLAVAAAGLVAGRAGAAQAALLVGGVALAALLVMFRDRLPVLWMAAGYLGVLLPLLFVETRFLR